jgi:predicted small secreted protein
MKKQLLIIGIMLLLFAAGLSGCEQTSTSNGNGQIQILSHNIEDTVYGKRVYGEIKNVGDKTDAYAVVTVKFYDNTSKLIHTEETQIQYMESDDIREFSVEYFFGEGNYSQYDHYTVEAWWV